eukprot:TRINITY_DN50126_c0_g1_i1.p1 TRINITY_DN50126_c0_g1~~TRINITY_DN50126_c0_g1_i1.p1  ORF type:complete len:409 (-),score=25.49 TRINITY_DN50126_c0_g1_i1:106-1332(-)
MSASSIVAVLLACLSRPFPARRTKRKLQNLTSEGLPVNVQFLHGGTAGSILDVIKNGIPVSGEHPSKLGPGLYVSMYEHHYDSWAKGISGTTWRDHVWLANIAPAMSRKNYPYVLFLQVSDGTRFALTPRQLWYGKSVAWYRDPPRKRCMNNFDILFIVSQKKDDGSVEDELCQSSLELMDDPLESECELVSADVLMRLWHVGCVQELKFNPGRDSASRLSRLAFNSRLAPLDDSLLLNVQFPSGARPPVAKMTSWLCPRTLQQKHEEVSPFQKAFTSVKAFQACGPALVNWANGKRRSRCGAPCDEANQYLDVVVEAFSRQRYLEPRARDSTAWWSAWWLRPNRGSLRQEKAELLREVACLHFKEAIKKVKKDRQTCTDVALEKLRPPECVNPFSSIDDTTSLCWWL